MATASGAPRRDALPVNDQNETRPEELIRARVAEREFLERAFLESADRESRRLGQELHDHLCQHLLGAAFSAKALAHTLEPASPAAIEADELARLINSAVVQMREIVRGLNPADLAASGLREALQKLAQHPRCRLECAHPVSLPDAEAARHTFRIAQEAVANAVRHSAAREIVLRLSEDAHSVSLEITDDGTGFDPDSTISRGLGVAMMKCRARALGGTIRFDTPDSGGTRVLLVIPKRK